MRRRGVSAAEVAAKVGVSPATVWSWMSGLRRRPTAQRIEALATVLGVTGDTVASWFRSKRVSDEAS